MAIIKPIFTNIQNKTGDALNSFGSVNLHIDIPERGQEINPAQLKASISFRRLLNGDGIRVEQKGGSFLCKCPFHPDKTPSFCVWSNDRGAKCFGCEWNGDVFKYVMDRTKCSFRTALLKLASFDQLHDTLSPHIQIVSKREEEITGYVRSDEELMNVQKYTQRILIDEWISERIASSRNWDPSTIDALAKEGSLGWAGDALAFIYNTGIKLRKWPEKEIRWESGSSGLWRSQFIGDASSVIVTEGEVDAITLLDGGGLQKANTAIVALPSATTFKESWKDLLAGKHVTLCLDGDQAGRQGVKKIIEFIKPVAASIKDFNPSEAAA